MSGEGSKSGSKDSGIGHLIRKLVEDRQKIDELQKFHEEIKKYDVRALKKNYSQKLSDLLAVHLADALRPTFPKILPDAQGKKKESRAGGGRGPKKVDVRLPTDYGMSLGVSIKTINFKDLATQRYTKNMERNDKELRSEADSLHKFQPQAVLAGLVLMPEEARNDKRKAGRSSFEHAMTIFSSRAGRTDAARDNDLFELLYIGTYSLEDVRLGELAVHDVSGYRQGSELPPSVGMPAFIEAILSFYEIRNRVKLTR